MSPMPARSDPELAVAIDLLDLDGSKLREIRFHGIRGGSPRASGTGRGLRDSDPGRCLSQWVDQWTRGWAWPSVIASRAWDDASAHAFREAAFRALEEEASLLGWPEVRCRLVKEQAISPRLRFSRAQLFDPTMSRRPYQESRVARRSQRRAMLDGIPIAP